MPEALSFHFSSLEESKKIRAVTSRPLPQEFRSPSLPKVDLKSEFRPYLSSENIFWLRREGFEPDRLVLAEQIHGAGVAQAEKPSLIPGVDAIFTAKNGLPLVIRTADCPAVIIFFPEVPAVGIAHSGWRGTRSNIAGNLIKAMRAHWPVSLASIKVAISPFIKSCCYEVGKEFTQFFPPEYLGRRDGKLFLDLEKALLRQITALGIAADGVSVSPQCTFCSEPPLYSYRRQHTTERLLTVASLME